MDLQSTGWLTAGLRPARIKNPQLLTRGLQIPEDKVNFNLTTVSLLIDRGEFNFDHEQISNRC